METAEEERQNGPDEKENIDFVRVARTRARHNKAVKQKKHAYIF